MAVVNNGRYSRHSVSPYSGVASAIDGNLYAVTNVTCDSHVITVTVNKQ